MNKGNTPPPERLALEEASTADLVREALDEAKELARIEIEIAKSEVQLEITQAKKAAVGLAIGAVSAMLFLSCLAMALVFALGATALAALGVAFGVLIIGGIAAWMGWSKVPKKPLERTRRRLETDVRELKEHVA